MATTWKCAKCDEEMKESTVTGEYLGFRAQATMLKCPSCGILFCDKDMAKEMRDGQEMIESKTGG